MVKVALSRFRFSQTNFLQFSSALQPKIYAALYSVNFWLQRGGKLEEICLAPTKTR